MLCQVHTHPQLARVVIAGVGLYTVVSSLFVIVIGSRSRRPNSFLCTSLATFRYAASTLFSMEAFLLLGLFQVTSYYCVSSSSVRCGRCVVRVLSLVVARICIKCHHFILLVHHLEVFAARLLMRQWLSVPRVTNPSRPNSSLTMRD